jgi:Protein of unknown function (DUF3048) N-terminal domain/Protein of unknown function (DUF3048) C-terminal domain
MSSHQTAPRAASTGGRRPSRRTLIAITIGVVAVLIGAVIAFAVTSGSPQPTPTPTARPTATPTEEPTRSPRPTASPSPTATPDARVRCPLDGEPLAEGYDPVEPALAVQIENHPEARPGRNLSRADIVVETLVEGNTTRFTGIFYCEATEGMTGPVRSARYYNIDLWQDLHVLTVGFGASPGAVQRFLNAGMPYPNGIEGGWPWYARYGAAQPPHNLYVDLEAMRAAVGTHPGLAALAGRVEELRPPWLFSEEPALPDGGREVTQIDISTNSYWYFGWRWDPAISAYVRSDQGVEIEDAATEELLSSTSLIVQRVTQEVVFGDPDPGGNPRVLQHLVGTGEGVLYTEGSAYDIAWSRPTAADGTTWTFADTGEPLELPPGEIWWHILPHDSPVTES